MSTESHPAAVTSTHPQRHGNPTSTMVEVPRAEYEQLKAFAESWLSFWDSDALADLVDREVVARIRSASHDLSGTARWSVAVGPSHRRLEELRNTPAWVRRCGHTGCRWLTTVYDEAEVTVWCPDHEAERRVAA